MDIRQQPEWGKYLSQIGWKIEMVRGCQILIRPLPFLKRSLIKIQHPRNPPPFKFIDEVAKKHQAFFVLLEPELPRFEEKLFKTYGFAKSSMSLTHTATIKINLRQSEQNLWASFSENARRNINKAYNHTLTTKISYLKDCPGEKEFEDFFTLLTNLSKLKKFYIPGRGEFYKKMQSLKDHSLFIFAHDKENPDNPCAVVWLSFFDKQLSYLHTGITEQGYKLLANYLLVWEALKEGQKQNLEIFDFEGIYDPRFPKDREKWFNFSQFKSRFHGEVVEYPPPYIKYYSKLFKLFSLCSQAIWKF